MYLYELIYFCLAVIIACVASYYVGFFANEAFSGSPASYLMVTISAIICMIFTREVIVRVELAKSRMKGD